MKKILIAMFMAASVIVAPLFLTGAVKTPVDFGKLKKALSLNKESDSLRNNQAAEKKKKYDEAQKILYSLFGTGKTLAANESCFFKKMKRQPHESFDENKTFTLSCVPGDLPVKLMFVFNPGTLSWDSYNSSPDATAERFVKIFENDNNTAFTGKIQFIKDETSYSGFEKNITIARYDQYSTLVRVYCKITSLKPLKVTEE